MGRSGVGGGGTSRGGGGGGGRGGMGRSSSGSRSGVTPNHRSGPSSFHFNPPRHHHHYHPVRHHTHYVHSGRSGGANSVISWIFAILFMACIFIFYFGRSFSLTPSITASTINREPLPTGAVQETEYYTDTLFWIGNDTELLNGMRHFYKETGVQPYLYITDTVDGSRNPTPSQMKEFANSLYDELFEDEAHLLLVFQDADGHYTDWVVTGAQAKQVVDDEAVNILLDYVDRYYYDSGLNESQLFGKSFYNAADRMMNKTISPMIIVAGSAVVIVLLVAGVYVFKKKQEQKKREDEQMERLLNMDLNQGSTVPSTEAQDLEQKYTN